MSRVHLILPDCQVKPGASIKHLSWAGQYAADKRPEVIVNLGDFADMPSLSSYDKGKRAFEGRRYIKDVDAVKRGMEALLTPMAKAKGYNPQLEFMLGNHCNRINRAVEASPELEGTISTEDLGYEEFGWQVHQFLEVAVIDGIAYSHFFPRAASGKVVQTRNGAPSARTQLIREGRSCTAGHSQGIDIACAPMAGRLQWGLIAGSYYLHNEDYLGPQGNNHWRGLVLKNGVNRGTYSPILVDIAYLKKRYAPLRNKGGNTPARKK
jgi:hypothetical protein